MANLYFKNPTFLDGLNISVRRGVKWDTLEKKSVELVDTDKPNFSISTVNITTKVMRFCDLVDADLKYEHDESCRTVSGLLSVMQEIYPGFDEREIVTIIYFILELGISQELHPSF